MNRLKHFFKVLKTWFSQHVFQHKSRKLTKFVNTKEKIEEAFFMGFRLRVEGAGETIELGIRNIEEAEFGTDTPDDSNARSTDVGATVKIKGKILTATDEDGADDTIKLAEWSTVPAEKLEAYREVTLEVEAAGQIVRKFTLPHAFVVDYKEIFGDSQGIGRFELLIKQKKDKTDDVNIDGNFK